MSNTSSFYIDTGTGIYKEINKLPNLMWCKSLHSCCVLHEQEWQETAFLLQMCEV